MPNNQIKSLTVDGVTYDIVDETSGYMKGMTILSYGSSTWQDFITAYNEQKVVYCRASSQANPASGEQTRLAFMAYVNDADTPTSVEFQYYRSVSTHTESQQGDQVFVYTLTSTGNWSVTTREASAKTSIGSNKEIETAYSNGVITIGHPDEYASTMTQAVYPITISPYGHIASYGNAVTIPTISIDRKVTTGVNIADITINGTTTELYAPTGGGGSVESVAVSNATNGGLSVSGSPITSSGTITIGHSNVLTSAQTTQAVYPIKIDKNGHISAYGSAVTIPTTAADVGAVPTTRTVNGKALSSDITLSASDVSALPSSTTIPTKTSDLTNDSGFVTTDEKLKTTALSSGTSYLIMGSTSGTAETKLHSTHLSFTSTRTFSIGSSGNKGTLRLYSSTSSSYTDLSNSATAARTITIPDATGTLALTSDIPTVPTKTSDLTNDSGFITSYTDEKLAISDINVNNTYYPILATDSTAAAARQYDNIGFEYRAFNGTAGDHSSGGNATLTLGNNKTHQTYKWKQGVLRLYGIGAYYVELKGEPTTNRTITIPNATGTLALTSDIPTVPTNVSAFTNDAGYLTSYTETDPTVPSWAKADTKPTYTASEVGAAATSHAHGNITSGGDITATAPTIANGDQIIINDHSASKITNGPTFDGSTTNKYLSPKGTWENIPDSDDIVIVEYDVDTYSTVATAITNGKEVICKISTENTHNYLTLSTYDLEDEYIIFSTVEYWGDNETAVYTAYLTTATQPWELNQIVLNNSSSTGGYFYGDSSTAASTETKEISLIKESFDGIYSIIAVHFNYGNTANALRLKINNYDTQGNPVYYRGVATSSGNKLLWNDGDTLIFMSIPSGYAFISKVAPSAVASSTTGVSISNHSTSSVTGVQSSTTTASKVTLGTAISVPNVTAAGSGSFTQGSFSGGSLTFAIDSTDNKQLNITFTAATHGTDTHVHTAPTLGTAISVPNVTGATDVTVPIKDTAATTVVTSATHTVTDNGHIHSLS